MMGVPLQAQGLGRVVSRPAANLNRLSRPVLWSAAINSSCCPASSMKRRDISASASPSPSSPTKSQPPAASHKRQKSTMAATDSTTILSKALENNKSWATQTSSANPSFFSESSKGQKPKILWLGCADSRVPESLILGLEPGQIFTHRNIANIITSTDLSAQSIIEFAVGAVGVEHIIVCGHTKCGGVAGALGNTSIGAIDVWLTPLRQIRQRLIKEGKFEGKSDDEKALMVVEENVKSGVEVVRQHQSVLKALNSRSVKVHGMVYELHSGLLKELDCDESEEDAQVRAFAHDLSEDAVKRRIAKFEEGGH